MQLTEIIVAISTTLSFLAFALYAIALSRMPSGHRPKTPSCDRFGQPLPMSENPGFEETEDEHL